MEFNDEFKKIILEQVEIFCPNKRTPHFSNEYYLDMIIHVLRDVVSFSSLQRLFNFPKKNHYKTIQDKHLKWTNAHIFEKSYKILLSKHKFSKINSQTTLNLKIDSTAIFNKTGSEMANYGEYKKKKTTKISVICNEDTDVLSVSLYKGSEHDTKTIMPSLKDIIDNVSFRKINLTGDLGYLSNLEKRTELLNHKIKLITPKRKNMKQKTNKIEKKHLRTRYKVENCISTNLKRYNRICVRRDKLLKTFKSFVYLALIASFKK